MSLVDSHGWLFRKDIHPIYTDSRNWVYLLKKGDYFYLINNKGYVAGHTGWLMAQEIESIVKGRKTLQWVHVHKEYIETIPKEYRAAALLLKE